MYRIVNTFPEFLEMWKAAARLSPEEQLDAWVARYMATYPELLRKQQEDYARGGEDWRRVALERVLPSWPARLPVMAQIQRDLAEVVGPVYRQAQHHLGLDCEVMVVIYVGLGCGAGWATTYQGKHACLFGLENIAECGWTTRESLAGLTAHELGHVFHAWCRGVFELEGEQSGPFWTLYAEGFAQRCEHIVMGYDSWHEQHGHRDGARDWITWCRDSQVKLAQEFLRRVRAGESTREFFGSWYDIEGWRQSGYFLGHEAIKRLEVQLPLARIALLSSEEVERAMEAILADMAGAR
ncbi:hypothetical protein U7230_07355 [Carboxydochorda subterranea]|uniref:DUF2268 domain-containing protein n=1 Tax=Carboxydichorda subterranea TaxID=3109565 RepID=A0ABZ1C1R5_9FIRM|nr:hypothetical protein [Limnochorda sp. L945t]WRP18800.1 hypothetical protein U7230_07355 [Limnochorda sp. L945t]